MLKYSVYRAICQAGRIFTGELRSLRPDSIHDLPSGSSTRSRAPRRRADRRSARSRTRRNRQLYRANPWPHAFQNGGEASPIIVFWRARRSLDCAHTLYRLKPALVENVLINQAAFDCVWLHSTQRCFTQVEQVAVADAPKA